MFKKVSSVILTLLTLLSLFACATNNKASDISTITDSEADPLSVRAVALDDVNIRSVAADEYERLGYVPKGASVQYLGLSENYCHIIYSGVEGYVSGDKLSLDGIMPVITSETETVSESSSSEASSASESSKAAVKGSTTSKSPTAAATAPKNNTTSKTTQTESKTTSTPTPVPVVKFPNPPSSYTLPFYIYIEKGSHTITIYGRDLKGDYSVVVRKYSTATGKLSGKTPVGEFTLGDRERWHAFGSSYAQYLTKINGTSIMIHSPLYKATSNDTLFPSSYNVIGTNASEGCCRTLTEAAYFVYTKCATGTIVKIVNGNPKGTSSSRPEALATTAIYDPTDPFAPGGVDRSGVVPDSVQIKMSSITLEVGGSEAISAAISPVGADTQTALTWSSENSGIATISGGKITAVSPGVTNIVVRTANGKSATCKVTVHEVNKDELRTAINLAVSKNASDFSQSSFADMQQKLAAANAVNKNPAALKAQVDTAKNELMAAVNRLGTDKSELQNAILLASNKNAADYSPSSWSELQQKLTAGNTVNNNQGAKQSQIDVAKTDIINAVNSLIPADTE